MFASIAIDGTASSGKGTVASLLAKKLGFFHIDSGVIYRVIAWHVISNSVDILNEKQVVEQIKDIKIELKPDRNKQIIYLNGEIFKKNVRQIKISNAASIISTYKEVRKLATNAQKNCAKKHNVIIDGRDIGTVVLPKAKVKIFLDAKPEIRARRRLIQNNLPEQEYNNVLSQILERDKRDISRKISPLKQAKDAYFIDTSYLNAEEVVEKILNYMKKS